MEHPFDPFWLTQQNGAMFSPCRSYRYSLWRTWDSQKPIVVFIGLNPSTADETVNDPTMRRCIGFARLWGYGGMVVVNLFAYCATKPTVLRHVADPVGKDTDSWIYTLCQYVARQVGGEHNSLDCEEAGQTHGSEKSHYESVSAKVILCWGNQGCLKGRDRTLLTLITPIITPYCLAMTKQGYPAHPLYLRKTLVPIPYCQPD